TRPADGRGLGVQLLHRHVDRHRARAQAAGEGRAGPVESALASDGLGRGLPLPAMSVRWAVLLLALGALAAAAVSALVYGASHALAAAAFFVACGAPVLVLSHILARNRRRIGSLSRQFGTGVALVFGLVLAGVGLVSLLMFVSPHDAYLLATLLVFAGALAV